MVDADVRKGVWLWSNRVVGCELFEHDDDLRGADPRRYARHPTGAVTPTGGYSGTVGAVMAEALCDPEARPVVLVTLPARMDQRVDDVLAAVRAAVEAL